MKTALLSVAAMLALGLIVTALVEKPVPILVWNMTDSAPMGLYRRSTASLAKGSWVLILPPKTAAALAVSRNYFAHGLPLVKQVAALSGDEVCRFGATVTINNLQAAEALRADSQGRPLPVWQGCQRLQDDEVFVLTPPPASFDSRYFGIISTANLIERIAPLWTYSAQ